MNENESKNSVLLPQRSGITAGIFQTLLLGGLCFSALGVGSKEIGQILGYSQLCMLLGTGIGPLVFGTCRDFLGMFKLSLRLAGVPPLLFGVFFAVQSLQSRTKAPA